MTEERQKQSLMTGYLDRRLSDPPPLVLITWNWVPVQILCYSSSVITRLYCSFRLLVEATQISYKCYDEYWAAKQATPLGLIIIFSRLASLFILLWRSCSLSENLLLFWNMQATKMGFKL